MGQIYVSEMDLYIVWVWFVHLTQICMGQIYPDGKERISVWFIVLNTWISCQILCLLPHSTDPKHSFPVQSKKLERSASIKVALCVSSDFHGP